MSPGLRLYRSSLGGLALQDAAFLRSLQEIFTVRVAECEVIDRMKDRIRASGLFDHMVAGFFLEIFSHGILQLMAGTGEHIIRITVQSTGFLPTV